MGILIALPIFISGNKEWWPKFESLEFVGLFTFFIFAGWFYSSTKKSKE